MITKISESEDIIAGLISDGRLIHVDPNTYLESVSRVSKAMVAVRRDFIKKAGESKRIAAGVIFNA